MSEEKTTNTGEEISTLEVVKQEYEKKIAEIEASYQQKIQEMHETHIAQIRTLMTTGTSPEAEEISKEINPYDEAIAKLREKYKLN